MESNDTPSLSRRQIVGAATTSLVAAMAPAAIAGQDGAQTNPRSVKQDPTAQYPKPPFRKQTQPWPGLAREMDPRPDHGETSYRGSGRLKGRKALITGGDSGIGRAAAIAMSREGADVAINYLPQEEPDAKDVVALLRGEGRKIVAIPGDIRNEGFCQRLVETAVKELGGLDIVVNNAARQQQRAKIEDLTSEDFDATFKTNVYAPFWITKAALKHLGPGAAIIFTTSEQAYNPSENLVDYAQTKACNMNVTKSLAKQLAPRGIRVNGVAPGPFWTPLQPSGGQDPEKLPEFGANTPMGRPGQPAELGPVYVLLASQESSFATGQVYGASGGHGNP